MHTLRDCRMLLLQIRLLPTADHCARAARHVARARAASHRHRWRYLRYGRPREPPAGRVRRLGVLRGVAKAASDGRPRHRPWAQLRALLNFGQLDAHERRGRCSESFNVARVILPPVK